jgi:hypothetical protein
MSADHCQVEYRFLEQVPLSAELGKFRINLENRKVQA